MFVWGKNCFGKIPIVVNAFFTMLFKKKVQDIIDRVQTW